MTRTLAWMLSLITGIHATAQWDDEDYAPRDTGMVRYTAGFDFREGLYFGFEDLRANRPAAGLAELRDEQGRPVTDLRQGNGKLRWTDSTGTQHGIDLRNCWGFCFRDIVYVRIGDGFSRIGLMGQLAHVVYESTYRNWGWADPRFGMGPMTTTVQEQRFLDMGTGTFLPVTAGGIYQAIQRDPGLRAEFEALSRRERNRTETIFRFARLYNERHPLNFPR